MLRCNYARRDSLTSYLFTIWVPSYFFIIYGLRSILMHNFDLLSLFRNKKLHFDLEHYLTIYLLLYYVHLVNLYYYIPRSLFCKTKIHIDLEHYLTIYLLLYSLRLANLLGVLLNSSFSFFARRMHYLNPRSLFLQDEDTLWPWTLLEYLLTSLLSMDCEVTLGITWLLVLFPRKTKIHTSATTQVPSYSPFAHGLQSKSRYDYNYLSWLQTDIFSLPSYFSIVYGPK